MQKLRTYISACLLAVMVLFSLAANAASFQTDYDAIEQTVQSVLMLGLIDENEEFVGNGSGFVAFNSSTLVTNYHVIDGAAEIWAVSDDRKALYVITKVLAASKEKDVAILEFYTGTQAPVLAPLKLSSGGGLRRGEPVVVIGSPQFITNEVTKGDISALYDDDGVPTIQFTAPVSPGSSGGPLLNDRGEVIGITRSTITSNQNTNRAIDISEVIALFSTREGADIIQYPWAYLSPSAPAEAPVPTIVPAAVAPGMAPNAAQSPTAVPDMTAAPILSPDSAASISISATAGQSGITLRWGVTPQQQSFSIYRITGSGEAERIGTTTSNQYVDKSAIEPGVYRYELRASGDDLSAPPAARIEVTSYYVLSDTLSSPRNFKVRAGEKRVSITWSKARYAKEYRIYRASSIEGPYMQVATVSDTAYNDKYARSGMTYYYTIRSVEGANVSETAKPGVAHMPGSTPSRKPAPTPSPSGKPLHTPAPIRLPMPIKTAAPASVPAPTSTPAPAIMPAATTAPMPVDTPAPASTPVPTAAPMPTNTPVPAKTPALRGEPANPIKFVDGELQWQKGDPHVKLFIQNISKKKTIDAFTLVFYCKDANGQKLLPKGSGEIFLRHAYTITIAPGERIMTGDVQLEGLPQAGTVHFAVAEFHVSNGDTVVIPESQWHFYHYPLPEAK